MTATDHRRAVADRNRAAILDAVLRLLAARQPLNMVALATEAGVSRPTLYAHFKTRADVIEAAVERVIGESVAIIEAATPEEGPADVALVRMLEAGWQRLATLDAVARAATEYLPAGHVQHTHAPLIKLTLAIVERGRREGTVRTDLPADWLVRAYYALIHAADEMARGDGPGRKRSFEMLGTSVLDLLRPR